MRSISIRAGVFVLGLVAVGGCYGKLEVGDADESNAGGDSSDGTVGTTSGSANGMSITSGASTSGSASEGSTDGSATSGGTGGTSSAFDDIPPALGSSEVCPNGLITGQTACETDGVRCRYQYGSAYNQECWCSRIWGDQQIWGCMDWKNPERCPLEEPEDLSACDGFVGLACWYPRSGECACRGDTGVWDCPQNKFFEVADPPELPASDRLVAELTDEERDTWCEWYSLIPHDVPPEDRPITGEYTEGVGCVYPVEFCQAVLPRLSKSECIANLSLSDCEATMETLTGCVIDMFSNDCGPFEYSCLDYLETPDCAGTIVLGEFGEDLTCHVRVQ